MFCMIYGCNTCSVLQASAIKLFSLLDLINTLIKKEVIPFLLEGAQGGFGQWRNPKIDVEVQWGPEITLKIHIKDFL